MKVFLFCYGIALMIIQTSYAQPKKVIYAEEHDVYSYTDDELGEIVKLYPELKEDITMPPDEVYVRRGLATFGNGDRRFSSEAGQDEYYILYAYFLKLKNGEVQFQKQRDRLISTFRLINSVYAMLSGGGTYFGHQYKRIVGYAEHAIDVQIDNEYYKRDYDYTAQKALYINMLKQYVSDEVASNHDIAPAEKENRKKHLFDIIETLSKNIICFADLKSVQQFQFSHY